MGISGEALAPGACPPLAYCELRRIVELSDAMTAVASNTVKRKKLRFMLALKRYTVYIVSYSLLSIVIQFSPTTFILWKEADQFYRFGLFSQ
jgi:hypothetical protein